MQIKWEVFTLEERKYIQDLIGRQQWALLATAVRIDDLEKEYWLQQIMNEYRPVHKPLESEVEKKMRGVRIESPEDEAKWQAELNAEREAHEAKVKADREKTDKIVEETKASLDESVKAEEKKEEVVEVKVDKQPKRRGRPAKSEITS